MIKMKKIISIILCLALFMPLMAYATDNTINQSQTNVNYNAPQGDVPIIVRAEFNGVELSQDIYNPTFIPFFNNIKLVGNSACASKTIDVQKWDNGLWTRTGFVVSFNSFAIGSCNISAAHEYPEGNHGKPLYNVTAKLEFAIHNNGDEAAPEKSPAYYVIYLDEEASLFDNEYTAELIVEGAITFSDIEDGAWEQPYVNELVERRVINGYEDGTFRPNAFVTRSEFAKMMYLALQLDKTWDYSGVIVDQPFFVDVIPDNWDYLYVKYVGRYMTGFKAVDGNVYFKGAEAAVREDMAVALVKALGLDGLENSDYANINEELGRIFSDYEEISPNLRKHVLIAYKHKLINGYPDGTFGAQKYITRAETAALFVKILRSDVMEKVVF